jgi:ankyrin repeat protein
MYLLSNKFIGDTNEKRLYKSLKKHGGTQLFKYVLSITNQTAEALIEAIFRLVVEAEDSEMVKFFLESKVNSNGRTCRLKDIPSLLTPLQYACLRGNVDLAEMLINAGAVVDEPGAGWRSSALVLAIFGANMWHDAHDWGDDYSVSSDDTSWDGLSDTHSSCDEADGESDESYPLLTLVQSLIRAGAKVNLEDLDPYSLDGVWVQEEFQSVRGLSEDLIYGGHTPLTAASKYRFPEIVSLLIEEGADVTAQTEHRTTALHECIYSWDELKSDVDETQKPLSLFDRGSAFEGCKRTTPVFDVARGLLEAGADANEAALYEFRYEWHSEDEDEMLYDSPYYSSSFSPMDLASFIPQSKLGLTELLIANGAHPTEKSLSIAVKAQNFEAYSVLLREGAPISEVTVQNILEIPSNPHGNCWVNRLLNVRGDAQTRNALWLEAIKRGMTDILILLGSGTLAPFSGISSSLTLAIESLCSNGNVDAFRHVLGLYSDRIPANQLLGASIHAAVSKGHYELAEILIDSGADVNAITSTGATALLVTVMRKNHRLAHKFRQRGALLEAESALCPYRHRAPGDVLLAAILVNDFVMINYLIEEGANINAPGRGTLSKCVNGCVCMIPLTAAIATKKWSLIPYLLFMGSDVNNPAELSECTSPLEAAVRCQKLDVVQTLIQNGANPRDEGAAKEAKTWNEPEVFKLLLMPTDYREEDRDDTQARSALRSAIEAKNLESITLQLERKQVDINRLEYYEAGWDVASTPLYDALGIFDPAPRFEVTALLVKYGADPNGIVWRNGVKAKSAILIAIERYLPMDLVGLLLDCAAKTNNALGWHEDYSYSPVQLAAKQGQLDVVQALLSHGSDANVVPPRSKEAPALWLALENENLDMVRCLINHGACPNAIHPNMRHTPLQAASRGGYIRIVEELIRLGADVNAPPHRFRGATALQFAAMEGFVGIAELLLQNGAEVDAPPAHVDGRSALEGAAEHGRLDMVQFLLNAGARVTGASQEQYNRAIKRASDNGHYAVHRLLESYFQQSL